jgi:LysM repeat protein
MLPMPFPPVHPAPSSIALKPGQPDCRGGISLLSRHPVGPPAARALALLMLLFVGLLWLPLASGQGASKRVALVVGVSQYQHVPRLPNPGNDAREVAGRLARFGFDVEALWQTSPRKADIDAALVRLRERSADADAVLVYFAGHGIEIGGQNYLLPADARLQDERDVRREAVALDDVLAEIQSTRRNRINLVILDACRENPFRVRLAGTGRSVVRGLGRPPAAPADTLIAFSTAANDVAADSAGANHSPYTQALLNVWDRSPSLEVGLFFRRVRGEVMQRTNPPQQPWEYGSLVNEFYFASTSTPTPAAPPSPPSPPPSAVAAISGACAEAEYVVRPGDSLVRVALAHGVDWREIARLNGIESPYVFEVGQRVRIPCIAAAAPQVAAELSTQGSESSPNNLIAWNWPALGGVLQRFGTGDGKGILLAGNLGDPVKAAAAGRVVYAGNGLRGYGNLIIMKHNDKYLSAYAHMRRLLVKEDQIIKPGQVIAEMGDSDASRVQLLFEIREQGKPVDPMRFLPTR